MTERLKEVNRALAEDATPVECDRVIKLRFKDNLTSFQSPREYHPSDSDDGYGDSSDIMEEDRFTGSLPGIRIPGSVVSFDVQAISPMSSSKDLKEISSTKNIRNNDVPVNMKVMNSPVASAKGKVGSNGNTNNGNTNNGDTNNGDTSNGDTSNRDTSNGNTSNGRTNKDLIENFSSSCQQTSAAKDCIAIPKLSLDTLDSSFIKPIGNPRNTLSSFSFEQTPLALAPSERGFLQIDSSGLADLKTFMEETSPSHSNYFHRGKIALKSLPPNEGFQTREAEGTDSDEDIPELDHMDDDDTPQEYALNNEPSSPLFCSSLPKYSTPVLVGSPASPEPRRYSKPGDDYRSREQQAVSDQYLAMEKVMPSGRNQQNVIKQSVFVDKHNNLVSSLPTAVTPSSIDSDFNSQYRPRKNLSPPRVRPSSAKQKLKTSQPQIVQTNDIKKEKTPRNHPIIKPQLLSPSKTSVTGTLQRPKPTVVASGPSGPFGPSGPSGPFGPSSLSFDAKLSKNSSSKNCQPCSSPTRKYCPPLRGPIRATETRLPIQARPFGSSERGPHNISRVTSGFASVRGRPHSATVRKSVSTSNLARSPEDNALHKRQREEAFQSWLQQKKKQISRKEKPQEAVPVPVTESEEARARKARAEEAFQSWLARKKEQLQMERKLKTQQQKLDDQSRYARTKTDCDLAYKEWCRRKREELRMPRPGVGVRRTQSLEQTWVSEQTRQVYTSALNRY